MCISAQLCESSGRLPFLPQCGCMFYQKLARDALLVPQKCTLIAALRSGGHHSVLVPHSLPHGTYQRKLPRTKVQTYCHDVQLSNMHEATRSRDFAVGADSMPEAEHPSGGLCCLDCGLRRPALAAGEACVPVHAEWQHKSHTIVQWHGKCRARACESGRHRQRPASSGGSTPQHLVQLLLRAGRPPRLGRTPALEEWRAAEVVERPALWCGSRASRACDRASCNPLQSALMNHAYMHSCHAPRHCTLSPDGLLRCSASPRALTYSSCAAGTIARASGNHQRCACRKCAAPSATQSSSIRCSCDTPPGTVKWCPGSCQHTAGPMLGGADGRAVCTGADSSRADAPGRGRYATKALYQSADDAFRARSWPP